MPALVVVDQRADLDVGLGAAADLQLAHAVGELLGELVGDGLVHVEAVRARARLADVAHLRDERALDRVVESASSKTRNGRCRRAPSRP
jgi:hypothetical protein